MNCVSSRLRTLVGGFWLIASLGLSIVPGFSSAFAAQAESGSCGRTVIVDDYLKPLQGMLPIQGPPRSGRMPFAPPGLRLEASGSGLVVGKGKVGFSIRDEAIQQVRRLNWIVTTRLTKVNARGKVVSFLDERSRWIKSPEGNQIPPFLHAVSGNPGYYRVDIEFARIGKRNRLAGYSVYARVMRPRLDLKVAVENPAVKPGGMARATLTNTGTVAIESIAYDFGFHVQAFTGERWLRVPNSPPRGITPKLVQILPPGAKRVGCLRYQVPSDQPPGAFRFVGQSPDGGMMYARFDVG